MLQLTIPTVLDGTAHLPRLQYWNGDPFLVKGLVAKSFRTEPMGPRVLHTSCSRASQSINQKHIKFIYAIAIFDIQARMLPSSVPYNAEHLCYEQTADAATTYNIKRLQAWFLRQLYGLRYSLVRRNADVN